MEKNFTVADVKRKCIAYNLPDYMHNAIADYLVHGAETGEFLEAVLSNDLMGAAAKADTTNQNLLFRYARFLFNVFPVGSYGSRQAYINWINQHNPQSKENVDDSEYPIREV